MMLATMEQVGNPFLVFGVAIPLLTAQAYAVARLGRQAGLGRWVYLQLALPVGLCVLMILVALNPCSDTPAGCGS